MSRTKSADTLAAREKTVIEGLIANLDNPAPHNLDAALVRAALRLLNIDDDEAMALRVFTHIYHLFFKELYEALQGGTSQAEALAAFKRDFLGLSA